MSRYNSPLAPPHTTDDPYHPCRRSVIEGTFVDTRTFDEPCPPTEKRIAEFDAKATARWPRRPSSSAPPRSTGRSGPGVSQRLLFLNEALIREHEFRVLDIQALADIYCC